MSLGTAQLRRDGGRQSPGMALLRRDGGTWDGSAEE